MAGDTGAVGSATLTAGNPTGSEGNPSGEAAVGGAAGAELFIGDLRGFDFNPLFFGDYTVDDFSDPTRQDPRLLPRDAFVRLDQRYMTLRAGRIPFLGGNIQSLDGAEVFFKPFQRVRLGGFAGMRNETLLTPDARPGHRYRGFAYGVNGQGGVGGFDARVFYQTVRNGGYQTREDLGGNLDWRIAPPLAVYGRVSGSLLVHEMSEAEGGARLNAGPVTLSGHLKWNDPNLLYFDADDPFIVFAGQPFWQAGGDATLSLLNGGLLFNAGGASGSVVDYGVNGGVQVGDRDSVRVDLAYARDGTVIGGGDNVSAWLTGASGLGALRTVASVGYVRSEGGILPLYSQGEAVGFLLSAELPLADSVTAGGRFEGAVSDRPFQYNALLFLQWRPTIATPSAGGPWGRGMGSWEKATVVASGSSVDRNRGVSWIVFPVQVIGTIQPAALADNTPSFHRLHETPECTDCHSEAPTSVRSADNLTVVDCSGCHDDGRGLTATIPPPRLNFPHQTHVTDQHIGCDRCHPGVKSVGLATRENLPTMNVCTSCHVTWRNECAKCHPAGPSGRMQSVFAEGSLRPTGSQGIDDNHTFDFRKQGGHREVAPIHLDYCLNCHSLEFASPGEPKGCQECHDPRELSTTRRHPAGWRTSHPSQARHDPASCRSCHEQNFCTDCHAKRNVTAGLTAVAPQSYHPEGWLAFTGGEHGARAALGGLSCSPCHRAEPVTSTGNPGRPAGQGTNCIGCHGTFANPHGKGMQGRLNALQANNPNMCQKCHAHSH